MASIIAATMAKGGTNPLNGEEIFQVKNIRNALSLMTTCGFCESSGDWAFKVGVPAISCWSGLIMMVIPKVCGIAIQSPLIDVQGNSIRGKKFAELFVKHFNLQNISFNPQNISCEMGSDFPLVMNAISCNDLPQLLELQNKKINLFDYDQDMRSSFHISIQNLQQNITDFLIDSFESWNVTLEKKLEFLNLKDRWGWTCLDTAQDVGFSTIQNRLEILGAIRNRTDTENQCSVIDVSDSEINYSTVSTQVEQHASVTFKILNAVKNNDMNYILSAKILGHDLYEADYDRRTALHIAACENRQEIASQLVNHMPDINILSKKDRHGHTPYDDATRLNYTKIAGILKYNYNRRCSIKLDALDFSEYLDKVNMLKHGLEFENESSIDDDDFEIQEKE